MTETPLTEAEVDEAERESTGLNGRIRSHIASLITDRMATSDQ
ncbi:hypothetical protein [Streptomyces sp. YKOK-J1]